MAKIDMDITKTEDLFEKMNNCVKVYIDNIDSFFGDIMASESWQGPSSKRYKEIISKEQNS